VDANRANKKRNIVVAKALRAAAAGATAALMGKEKKWDVLRLSNFRFSQQMLDFAARMRMAPWPDLFLTHFRAPHKPSWQDVLFLDGHLDTMVSDFLTKHAETVRQQATEAFNKQPHHLHRQEQVQQAQADGDRALQASRSGARRHRRSSRAASSRKRKASQSGASRRQRPARAAAAQASGRPSTRSGGANTRSTRSGSVAPQAASPVIENTEHEQAASRPQQLRSSSDLTATTIHLQHLPVSRGRPRPLTTGHSVSIPGPAAAAADATYRRQRRHQSHLERMLSTASTPAVMATGAHGE